MKPQPLGLEPSFGFGDRLGLATPGHLRALRDHGGLIRGVMAQQSVREMQRTGRTPEQVMIATAEALKGTDFRGPWGADADHLKTPQDVDATAAAGFCFFTLDPSRHVDPQADNYSLSQLAQRFAAVRSEMGWVEQYAGRSVSIKEGPTLSFERLAVERAAVKYGRAIAGTIELARHVAKAMTQRGPFELEVSVDESEQPTTLVEHYIFADQLRRAGVKIVSLAPRFVGGFEKGVDYKGDLAALERSLTDHAALARELGPYKLSLHSGSDKLSMYSRFARATRGCFHVKTAGTSYLEALRVVARHDGALFGHVVELARRSYQADRATYHVSASLAGTPDPRKSSAAELEQAYLETWASVRPGRGFTQPGRQILHCTFGSVLTDATLGPAVLACLRQNAPTYEQVLAEHFGRHLTALREGM